MSSAMTIVSDDEYILKKIEVVSPYLRYIGRADFGSLTSQNKWQIIRITNVAGVETKEFATFGSFKNIWDNRSTYFSAFTSPSGVTGSSATASGQSMSAAATKTATGDIIASTDVSAFQGVYFQLSGTWDGSVGVDISNNATNWTQIPAVEVGSQAQVLDQLTNGNFYFPVQAKYFRLRANAYTSGTIVANVTYSSVAPALPPGDHSSSWDTDSVSIYHHENVFNGSTSATGVVVSGTNDSEDSICFHLTGPFNAVVTLQVSSDGGSNWNIVPIYSVASKTWKESAQLLDSANYTAKLTGLEWRIYVVYTSGIIIADGFTTSAAMVSSGDSTPLSPKFAKANVSASQTDSVMVTAVSAKKIRVLNYTILVGATATNVTFNSKGAGAGTAISSLKACNANGGIAPGEGILGHFETTSGEALTVTTGAGSSVGIDITYIEV